MLAKSILGLSDSLNNAECPRSFSPEYMKGNLEHALHSLMRAKELQPGNMDIINDLNYVTGIYSRHNTCKETHETSVNTSLQKKKEDDTNSDALIVADHSIEKSQQPIDDSQIVSILK